MKKSVVINDAMLGELQSILDLQKLSYQENARRYNNYRIMPLKQTLADMEADFSRCTFLSARIDGVMVGSIRAYREEETCFIVRLFVHPEYRDHGIGKSLLKAVEERFAGVARYELFTGYRDEKNLAFYEKMGYRRFREETHEDGMTFYYMEKENSAK